MPCARRFDTQRRSAQHARQIVEEVVGTWIEVSEPGDLGKRTISGDECGVAAQRARRKHGIERTEHVGRFEARARYSPGSLGALALATKS